MPDLSFFDRRPPLALKDIAGISGAELAGDAAADYQIEDVAPLDKAGPKDLSFFDNIKYKDQFMATKAGACLVSPQMVPFAPQGVHLLVSKSPYRSYALAAQGFYPETPGTASIAPGAHIDPSAQIGKGCIIDHNAVISGGAVIGDNSWIETGAVIGKNVKIGTKCRIGLNATVTHAHLGDHVRVYPGARIGQDGFGFAIDPRGYVKVPQLGRVIVEDHVEIGANTTIDRGSGPDTTIGAGTWIDNLVQIGHNVKIGRGCIIVAQVGISGSTVVEDYVAFGGQAGVAGHLKIGRGARIAAKSGVIRDVPAGEEQMGYPSLPKRQFMRHIALLNRLIKKEKTS